MALEFPFGARSPFVERSEKPNPVVRSAAGLGFSRGSKHERTLAETRTFLFAGSQIAMRH